MAVVIAVATVLIAWSATRVHLGERAVAFALVAAVTLGLALLGAVRLPIAKSHFSFSEFFVFFTMLQFGGEPAILLGAAEPFVSSYRVTKSPVKRIFNAAAVGCSTAATVWTLRLAFGSFSDLNQGEYSLKTVVATGLMGLVLFVVNSVLVGLGISLKADRPFWQLWRQYYGWAIIPVVASASAAVVTVRLVHTFGFYSLLVTVPIVASVYLLFNTYLKNIASYEAQAEQARRHLAELQESEERFRSAFDNAAIGMALVSTEGKWVKVNKALCELLGRAEADLLGADVKSCVHPDDLPPFFAPIEEIVSGNTETHQAEARLLRRTSDELWTLVSIARIRDPQTHSPQLAFQIQDITDRKRAEQQLLHDAFHDALTGLPNRALFMDRLTVAIDQARRSRRRQFAVLFLDVDRFKIVNDSLGHAAGDQLLVGIAHRLEACIAPGDTVARLGGDEFTLLLDGIDDARDAVHVAERIAEALKRPFAVGGREIFATASTGIAPSSTGYERPDEILRDADTAMYRAKAAGRARNEVFQRAMHARAMTLLQVENDLRRALERREFVVHYQPIVSLLSGGIEGFEALVRWRHPEQGFISPMEFIPVAEESGLIAPIGEWVLRESCRQVHAWREVFPERARLSVAVNLSSKQFTQCDLYDQITKTLVETGCDPHDLKLEITESAVMENVETAIAMIGRLKDLGIEWSIDDFGTGYSSLSQLHCFPASTLKIDRSFVMGLGESGGNVEIVHTILMLARALGMRVVAEGIETEEQLAQLRTLGCESGQGYLFSKPLAAPEATALLGSNLAFPIPKEPAFVFTEA